MDERVGDQFGRCALIVAFGKQARDQPDHHGVRLTAFAALARQDVGNAPAKWDAHFERRGSFQDVAKCFIGFIRLER